MNATSAMNGLSILLCTAAALFEGVDMASMGLAAPQLGLEYHLTPAQIGFSLSASTLGTMVGAIIAGRLADRYGRKSGLIGSMLAVGAFSLATIVARDFDWLLLVRFMVGVGLGGAFPILIALSAEASRAESRATAISLVYAGQPVGALLLGLTISVGVAAADWRTIFVIGGAGPLLVSVLLWFLLPESSSYRAAQNPVAGERATSAADVLHALVGDRRATSTGLICASVLLTMSVLYMLLNWIPSLMVAKGFTHLQATVTAMCLYFGSALGTVSFGVATDRIAKRVAIVAAYSLFVIALVGLGRAREFPTTLLFAGLAGVAMSGSQLILYAITASYFTVLVRATALGVVVAVGRIGGIIGPVGAGFLMQSGHGASSVMAAALPTVVLAAICAVALASRPISVGRPALG